MLKNIIAAAVVSVVILGECLVAYLLIPGTDDLQAWAKSQEGASSKASQDNLHAPDHAAEMGGHEPEIEVDLGKFAVVVHKPADSYTMRINFHLIATVPEKEHAEFGKLYAKCQHRLRDQVIYEIRNSEMSDLTDPGLALIKRKILAKSNGLLGKPLIRTVVFSDYAFVEQ